MLDRIKMSLYYFPFLNLSIFCIQTAFSIKQRLSFDQNKSNRHLRKMTDIPISKIKQIGFRASHCKFANFFTYFQVPNMELKRFNKSPFQIFWKISSLPRYILSWKLCRSKNGRSFDFSLQIISKMFPDFLISRCCTISNVVEESFSLLSLI